MKVLERIQNAHISAKSLAHFHLFATFVWACLVIPSVLFWKESIAWVVLMSV